MWNYFIQAVDALSEKQPQIASNISYESIYVIDDVLKLNATRYYHDIHLWQIYLLPQFMLNIGVI